MCRDVFPDTPYARAYGVESDESIRAAAFGTTPDSTWRWWSGNVSTTRDDFHRVGPYDQAFRAYGWEDVEWGYRLHLTGREILVAPGFATLHHGPVTSSAERLERAFASGAARARFVAKHPDALSEEPDALSAWNVLVRASALAMTSVTATKTGRALDRVVDRLPRYVAHKAVALGVQSAAMAGRRAAGSGA